MGGKINEAEGDNVEKVKGSKERSDSESEGSGEENTRIEDRAGREEQVI